MPPRTKSTAYQRKGNDPRFDLRSELYRIAGVDLTDIPGVSAATAQVIPTEIGTDVSRFRNASAFASWLGLCPEKRVSGGKVLSCKTRQVKNRAATALRMGANSPCRAKGYFGEFFRRMRAKLQLESSDRDAGCPTCCWQVNTPVFGFKSRCRATSSRIRRRATESFRKTLRYL
jgi:transposase